MSNNGIFSKNPTGYLVLFIVLFVVCLVLTVLFFEEIESDPWGITFAIFTVIFFFLAALAFFQKQNQSLIRQIEDNNDNSIALIARQTGKQQFYSR